MSWRDSYSLEGRVAIVTGAGHGIGEGIASALAERGALVVVNDIVESRADAVARAINERGGTALGIPADTSSVADVKRLITCAQDAFGPAHILVNNAGVMLHGTFVDHSVEDWDRVFAVNVRGVFLCCKEVLPGMIERGHGNIVNIASISAFHTTREHSAYAASKAAIVTLTRDVASEVAEFGVRVNAIAPGPIDSPGTRVTPHDGVLVRRVGKPADIAGAVAFLVSDAASYIVGETLSVAGGADLKSDRDGFDGERPFTDSGARLGT